MDAIFAVVGKIGSFAVGPYEKNPFGRLANGDDGNRVKREGEGILQFFFVEIQRSSPGWCPKSSLKHFEK